MRPRRPRWTIVVVGQSPALASGQSKMIGYLLGHRYEHVRLIHVPMNFSKGMGEVGKASGMKVWRLLVLIWAIWRTTIGLRLRGERPVLYFPPASPNLTPVLRDIVILTLSRPLFARTIFHFHAAGLGAFRDRIPRLLRPFFDFAYGRPDVTIATARSGLVDGESQRTRTNLVVHNGIPELPVAVGRRRPVPPPIIRLLFVGLLVEDKGILVLLESLALLKADGAQFEVQMVGRFQTAALANRAHALVVRHGLEQQVEFSGELHGDSLLQAYADADIFCFPSFFAAESFGLVCVEAMRAGLPVVATEWRGIPEVVEDGRTGILVPPGEVRPLAAGLARLIEQPELRAEFGRCGRERFLSRFTVDRFCDEMGDVFLRAISEPKAIRPTPLFKEMTDELE